MSCCFFTHPTTTETSTLSLHDALPIYCAVCASAGERSDDRGRCRICARRRREPQAQPALGAFYVLFFPDPVREDRKSTRLNSSHANISYAVFCLKKKNRLTTRTTHSVA